jgi:hypothetical protein
VRVPAYLEPGEVATACEMTTGKVRSLLERAGILEKLGAHHVVGESRLKARLPELYDRVFEYYELQAESGPSEAKRA